MYSRLAQAVVEDDPTIELLQSVPPGQLHMNMLFAAVQYLLIENPRNRLASFYPSLGGTSDGPTLDTEFVRFVGRQREPIRELLLSRRVQTNEVRRCTFLLPAYNLVSARAGQPIALIEVGTSAGLNQNVDRYRYRYVSQAGEVGVGEGSPLLLTADTGSSVPDEAHTLPPIAWRTGVDLNPVDVTKPDEARWLRALVWPDQVERHRRLAAALEIAEKHPPSLVAGDAVDMLPSLVHAAPQSAAVVVQHSFVLNQFRSSARRRFFDLLDALAADRPIYRLGAEWLAQRKGTMLELTTHGADPTTTTIASVHHHGEWLRWLHPTG